ncbi:lysosomal-associated transmembrane protein 4A isoform X2 [Sitodiplosis mosellana]|uniref:lysosomal-associated transmembrane protein 4A isoform X2 n=1 Tax=Sitodiplosis mosellana TaxID=263140 RepID=UPI002444F639|nr:lysosomal-associated transmembrane protein 4A isoform X2 [Sitodiplosis mosellana]
MVDSKIPETGAYQHMHVTYKFLFLEMQIIRLKMGPARNKEWTCCFGFHVRTITIFIGVWHLLLNMLTLGILATIIRNPAMMQELESGYDDFGRLEALPTPLSKIDPPYAYRDHSLNYQNVDLGGFVCICMIAISLMLIFGAVKYKPSHLLPFFCLQLFDFAITTLTAAGYLCFLRSIHSIIDESHRLPWREELLKLSPHLLGVVVLFVVLLKAYAIGIVWRCYKYLTMRQHNIQSMLPYIIPDNVVRQDLLPDYEEAIQGMKQQPPPPYYQAMTGSQMVPNNINENQFMQSTAGNIEIDPPAYETEGNYTPFANHIPLSQTGSIASEVDILPQINRQFQEPSIN